MSVTYGDKNETNTIDGAGNLHVHIKLYESKSNIIF